MTKFLLSILLVFGIFLVFSCTRKGQTNLINSEKDNANLEVSNYAKEKFDTNYVIKYNETKEYVIIAKFQKVRPSDLNPTIRFEILQVNPLESIFQDAVAQGEFEWEDTYVVKVKSNQGIPDPNGKVEKKTYRYHAKNRKKYSGGFLNNKN